MNKQLDITDLKIDDALIVSIVPFHRGAGIAGYFAGISKNGKVLTFEKSLTSKRASAVVEWDFWKINKNNERTHCCKNCCENESA